MIERHKELKMLSRELNFQGCPRSRTAISWAKYIIKTGWLHLHRQEVKVWTATVLSFVPIRLTHAMHPTSCLMKRNLDMFFCWMKKPWCWLFSAFHTSSVPVNLWTEIICLATRWAFLGVISWFAILGIEKCSYRSQFVYKYRLVFPSGIHTEAEFD